MIKIADYRGYSISQNGIWYIISLKGRRVLQMRKANNNPFLEVDHMIAVKVQPSVKASGYAPSKKSSDVYTKGVIKPRKKKVKRVSFTTKDGRKVSFKTK